MATLFRTQRPRFPRYISDGSGRDYYIKFNNAGYWDDQYKIKINPNYEYSKYNNYHTLFHQAAPVKFIPSGHGRETYIINSMGLYHVQKPLASYKLDDFLRESSSLERIPKNNNKRYMSKGEKRYNIKLKSLEKQLVHRLYNVPMSLKKEKEKEENENEDENNTLPNLGRKKENLYKKINSNYDFSLDGEEKLNTLQSVPSHSFNKFKKSIFNYKNKNFGIISLKNDFNKVVTQSQNIEKYELNNKSRRNNNETDYNIYRNGKMGCRIKELKTLNNCFSESWKNNNKRIKTEGNQTRNNYLSPEKQIKTLKKNKLNISYKPYSEKKYKTIEY